MSLHRQEKLPSWEDFAATNRTMRHIVDGLRDPPGTREFKSTQSGFPHTLSSSTPPILSANAIKMENSDTSRDVSNKLDPQSSTTEHPHVASNKSEDLRKCREAFLGISELLKSTVLYLQHIETFVENEADLTMKVVEGVSFQPYRPSGFNRSVEEFTNRRDRHSIGILPPGICNEALVLEESYIGLKHSLFACLRTISECFNNRKKVYFEEIGKCKEISNNAIRNAVQVRCF